MDISTGLIAKGLAGLVAVAATATGITFGDQILKFWQKSEPTKWDNTLIDYLEEKEKIDRDITFEVKTGKNANTDISTDFPTFEVGDKKKKLIITVTVTTSNANLKGADSTKLNEKNGGQDWTWECKIILTKPKVDGENLPLEHQEKLIGSSGFFNKLTANNNKELKAKFIRNCAESRDGNKAAEYEGKEKLGDGEKIVSERTFELKKTNDETKWKIKRGEYNEWFSTSSQKKPTGQ